MGWQRSVSSGNSRGESVALPVLVSRACLHIPWIMVPSSIFKANSVASANLSLYASAAIPLFLILTTLPSSYKDLYDDTGPTWVIQDKFPI